MMGFRVLLFKELREQLRTKRLVAVVVVFVIFGVLGVLTDRYMKQLFDAMGTGAGTGAESSTIKSLIPSPSLDGVATQIIKNLSQFGIICALLLAMGSVAWEKDRGTAGMILTKPASRAAFLGAKLIAISITLGVAMALGCAFAYLYTLLLYPSVFPIGGYVAMALLMWWMGVAFAAVTLLGSTLTRSAIAAAGIGLVALLITGIAGALPHIGPYMPSSLGDTAQKLMLGHDAGQILGPVLFNIALVPVLLGISWLAFRRQEL